MDELKKKTEQETDREVKEQQGQKDDISETWAQETIADLDDFIESQGIYIRQ
ncbi:MAG: hypothetical protein PUF13_03240 [Lachnospiraceae bacterium]|nr:hypothetical protein [Lachnospiraceae bacterium]